MKKWLAALLAVLVLALPLSSLAESPDELMEKALDAGLTLETQLSLTPGDLPFGEEINAPLSDLLSAMSIYQLTSREGRNAFALQFSGQDAFRADWEAGEDRFYFSSNWLGSDVLSFNEEEALAAVNRLTQLLGGTSSLDMADLEEQLAGFAAASELSFSEEDLAALTAYVQQLMERVEVSEVTQQPRNCDAAEQMLTLTLTMEDCAQYYEIICTALLNNPQYMSLLEQMNSSFTMNGETMTAREFLEKLPDAVRSLDGTIEEIPVVIYLDSAGEPVMVTMDMSIATPEEAPVTLAFELTRQTTSDGIGWAANLEAAQDGVALAGITASYLANSQRLDVFSLAVVAKQEGADDVEMLSVNYLANKDYNESTAKRDATLTLSFRPDVDQEPLALTLEYTTDAAFDGKSASRNDVAKVYLTGEEEPFLTGTRAITSVEALASLAEGNVVTPGAMDDTEFQTFLNQTLATLTASATKALQLLPESVLQVVLGAMYML